MEAPPGHSVLGPPLATPRCVPNLGSVGQELVLAAVEKVEEGFADLWSKFTELLCDEGIGIDNDGMAWVRPRGSCAGRRYGFRFAGGVVRSKTRQWGASCSDSGDVPRWSLVPSGARVVQSLRFQGDVGAETVPVACRSRAKVSRFRGSTNTLIECGSTSTLWCPESAKPEPRLVRFRPMLDRLRHSGQH